MAEVGVIWVAAPSLPKLEAELTRRLAGYAPEAVLSVSHAAAVSATKKTGGIWSSVRLRSDVEYSAIVLIRTE